MLHDPLLDKFREKKAFSKKIGRAMGRKDDHSLKRLRKALPTYTLDHVVRERLGFILFFFAASHPSHFCFGLNPEVFQITLFHSSRLMIFHTCSGMRYCWELQISNLRRRSARHRRRIVHDTSASYFAIIKEDPCQQGPKLQQAST